MKYIGKDSTPLNERLCLLFKQQLVGKEFHYILECSASEKIRTHISRQEIL